MINFRKAIATLDNEWIPFYGAYKGYQNSRPISISPCCMLKEDPSSLKRELWGMYHATMIIGAPLAVVFHHYLLPLISK